MNFNRYLLIFSLIILTSCEQRVIVEDVKDTVVCSSPNFSVSEDDAIVIPDADNPVVWEGTYSTNTITIGFTIDLGIDGETETFNFVFEKTDECLKVIKAYEYYYGSYAGISALTEVDILELEINEWEIDKKLTGRIAYRDHHNKEIYNRNFWITLTEDDFKEEETEFQFFPECFANKLPISIDLDDDGTIDYEMIAEQEQNTGNNPSFTEYTIKLISTDETINEILSPKGIKAPFPVIFEPPFSSENTRKYDANRFNSADVRNSLDVFYEFEAPYQNYNFFLNNNLTNRKEFLNDKDDYYLVRLIRNDTYFYGWIKVDYSTEDCKIEVLDTYLNSNPNEHIIVN